jgi:hypothetical protein
LYYYNRLDVLENRALKKPFRPEREEVTATVK